MDEPGLGKTYEVWGTIVSNPLQGYSLIIVPAHLISMWLQERSNHLSEIGQKLCPVHTYYGKHRNCNFFSNVRYPSKQKIVITSYAILAKLWNIWENFTKGKNDEEDQEKIDVAKFFFQTYWARVVLDEAHMIRNCKTKQSKSIRALSTARHWALTATPIVNKLDDLFALFNFISVRPYVGKQGKRLWNTFIRTASFHDMIPLRHLLADFGLKRDKSVLQLDAPIMHCMELKMSGYQSEFYEVLFNYCRDRTSRLLDRIKKLQNNGRSQNSSSAIHGIEAATQVTYCLSCALTQILRLKQAASCPLLALRNMKRLHKIISVEDIDRLKWGNSETMEKILARLKGLQNSTEKECPVCFDDEVDTLSLPCRHACCLSCWNTLLSVSNKCPICRTTVVSLTPMKSELNSLTKFNMLPDEMEVEARDDDKIEYASCKIDAMLKFLYEKFAMNCEAKIIIVSQWHGFLKLVRDKISKDAPNWKDLIMTGSSGTAEQRQKIVNEFQTNVNVKLLYMTLTAGGVGLTLTAATDMVFLDFWWNPAIHYQAQNRIHRIGQTKQVHVTTMIVKDTIEEVIQVIIDHKFLISNRLMADSEPSLTSNQWLGKIRCCLSLETDSANDMDGEPANDMDGEPENDMRE